MTWRTLAARLALLELVTGGQLKRRQGQAAAYDTLAELPWTRASGRHQVIAVAPERAADLEALLTRVWPAWRDVQAQLHAAGLAPTPEGYARYQDRERAAALPRLPTRLNRHTAAALTAAHSKTTLTPERHAALGAAQLTHDGIIRLRPPGGLTAVTGAGTLELSAIAACLGEVALPERAFLDGLELRGALRAVLLVENLGAWRDMPHPPGWLLALVPGWETTTARRLIAVCRGTPLLHFGDLDPDGVKIFLHLRRYAPDLRWFVPAFWFADGATVRVRKGGWPRDLDLSFAPPAVQALAARGQWMEQEQLVLDPRLEAALEELLRAPPPAS